MWKLGIWTVADWEILDVKDRNKRGGERRRASRSKLVWFFVCIFLKRQLQRVSILRRNPLVYVGLSQLAHFGGIFINRVPFSSTISLVELCMLQSTLSGRARRERKQAIIRERKAGLLGKVSETEWISKVGRGGDLGGRGEGSLWTTTCNGGCQWPSTCSRSLQSLTWCYPPWGFQFECMFPALFAYCFSPELIFYNTFLFISTREGRQRGSELCWTWRSG